MTPHRAYHIVDYYSTKGPFVPDQWESHITTDHTKQIIAIAKDISQALKSLSQTFELIDPIGYQCIDDQLSLVDAILQEPLLSKYAQKKKLLPVIKMLRPIAYTASNDSGFIFLNTFVTAYTRFKAGHGAFADVFAEDQAVYEAIRRHCGTNNDFWGNRKQVSPGSLGLSGIITSVIDRREVRFFRQTPQFKNIPAFLVGLFEETHE